MQICIQFINYKVFTEFQMNPSPRFILKLIRFLLSSVNLFSIHIREAESQVPDKLLQFQAIPITQRQIGSKASNTDLNHYINHLQFPTIFHKHRSD